MTGLDFGTLPTGDEYGRYFNLLGRAFGMLLNTYQLRKVGDTFEAERVPAFLRRFLNDIEALRMKYTYTRQDRSLNIDLSDSGFPNAFEIGNLTIDMMRNQEVLAQLPPRQFLLKTMLDLMLSDRKNPLQMLRQLSERTYHEMLVEADLFQQFTFGELSFRGEDNQLRRYLCTWACYDQTQNLPFIHFMMFDQDATEAPLHEPGPNQVEFMHVLRNEGNRAPDVGILALTIDDAIEWLHPKMVKRLRIGPLYSPLLFRAGQYPVEESEAHRAMREFLTTHCRSEGEFVFCFKEELVVSERQERSPSFLRPIQGKAREVFSFPDTDFEAQDHHATAIFRNALLPHHLIQHLDRATRESIPDLGRVKQFISYDEKGDLNGIRQ